MKKLKQALINLTEDGSGLTNPMMEKFLDALKPFLKIDLEKCYYHYGLIILQDDDYLTKVKNFLKKVRSENKDEATYRFDKFQIKSSKGRGGFELRLVGHMGYFLLNDDEDCLEEMFCEFKYIKGEYIEL
jgi:hypothetical protein